MMKFWGYPVLIGVLSINLGVGQNFVAPMPSTVPCTGDMSCQGALGFRPSMKCIQNVCMCPMTDKPGFYDYCKVEAPQSRNAPALVEPVIKRICSNDTECNLENGSCNRLTKQCECDPGFVATKNNKCLKAAEDLRGPCQEPEQCAQNVKNAVCGTDGKCKCGDGFHEVSKAECAKSAGYQGGCDTDQECLTVQGAKCVQVLSNDNETLTHSRRCYCEFQHVINGNKNKCLRLAEYVNMACEEQIQCTQLLKDVECKDQRCQCTSGLHYAAGKKECTPNKGLGDECVPGQESCYQAAGGKNALRCSKRFNKCECEKSFKEVNGLCMSDSAGAANQISSTLMLAVCWWVFLITYCNR